MRHENRDNMFGTYKRCLAFPHSRSDLMCLLVMGSFQVIDYIVCAGMVIGSGLIGLGYATWSSAPPSGDSTSAYLMGGRQMTVLPISLSLIAGYISGMSLQGFPGEIYSFGIAVVCVFPTQLINGFINQYVTLPVFYQLNLTSSYEYLEKRFDKKVRLLGSFFIFLQTILTSTTTVYMAVQAFNQVSGVDSVTTRTLVCILCTFYTISGGFKAVVWADTVQAVIIMIGMMTLAIKGTVDIGGPDLVWKRSYEGGRLDLPSLQANLTILYTVWGVTIASAFNATPSYTLNQDAVQRYLALPTLRQARIAAWIYSVGVLIFFLGNAYIGLLIFATYHDCDPLATGQVQTPDQLLMLMVTRVLTGFPGLPGIFAATVFSVCLSTFSTGLNTAALIVWEDFAKPRLPRDIDDWTIGIIVRAAVAAVALICFGLMYIFERVKIIHLFAFTLRTMIFGPILGVFMGGLLLPWMNEHGALYGGIIGFSFAAVTVIGTQYATITGLTRLPFKATSVLGCPPFYNISSTLAVPVQVERYVFPLFKISYIWFTFFGAIITLVAGAIVSFFTGPTDLDELDPRLVAPVARKVLPKKNDEVESVPMTSLKDRPTGSSHSQEYRAISQLVFPRGRPSL